LLSQIKSTDHPFALAMRLVSPSLFRESIAELVRSSQWALLWNVVLYIPTLALACIDIIPSIPLQGVPLVPLDARSVLASLAKHGMSSSLTTFLCTTLREDIVDVRSRIDQVVLPRTPQDLSSLWRQCTSVEAQDWLLRGISQWPISAAYCTLLLAQEAALFDGTAISLLQWAWERANGDSLLGAVQKIVSNSDPKCVSSSLAALQHALMNKWRGVELIEVPILFFLLFFFVFLPDL